MRWNARLAVLAMVAVVGIPGALRAQDMNVMFTGDSLEYLLGEAPFQLPDTLRDFRFEGDRTQRVPLWFEDGTAVGVKWAMAPRGGDRFNNSPRYEIAAYEIQKLFLEDSEYVVPPTVPRMVPLEWYRTVDEDADATFDGGESVLVVLQYLLFNVTDTVDVFDEDRFESDPVYARHWANANLLTYLIEHKDSNRGNLMISTIPTNPRIFAVDNGVAFRSQESNRGTRWSRLQVDRFPRATVDRLRTVTEEDLHETLGVLAQFERQGDQLVRVAPTGNLRSGRGVREEDGVVQIGLEDREIRDIWRRVERFLSDVDRGRVEVF